MGSTIEEYVKRNLFGVRIDTVGIFSSIFTLCDQFSLHNHLVELKGQVLSVYIWYRRLALCSASQLPNPS